MSLVLLMTLGAGVLYNDGDQSMKAIWNGTVIAESARTVVLDGYHYFPKSSVKMDYLKSNSFSTTCPAKGQASYWDVVVDGKSVSNAAFAYADPKPGASQVKGYIAFWTNEKSLLGTVEVVQ